MIPGIDEYLIVNGTPTEGWPAYATLHEATISFEEMGERIIRAQVKIDGTVVPDFVGSEWALLYKNELFVLNTHTPQARKDTSTRCSLFDLVFESQPVSQLKHLFFVELAEVATNTLIINKFVCPLRLKAEDFIVAFNGVLKYYFGNAFSMELDPQAELPEEALQVQDIDINYTYLWEALANIYNVYKLVWRIAKVQGGFKIIVGDSVSSIDDHIFQYGYDGGLQSVERQIEDAAIYNRLFGRGGEKNLPYRYFKKVDPNNENFAGDPDACAELANVYFDRILDSNFRYYVKGWLRNPNRQVTPDYPYPSTPEPAEVQQHWAYQKGYTDDGFDPVEYVEDTASIAEYGVRHGKLEDDDEIYPTIQGITVSPYGRIDEVIAVGTITDDDDTGGTGGVQTIALSDMTTRILNYDSRDHIIDSRTHYDVTLTGDQFSIPASCGATISWSKRAYIDTSGDANHASVTVGKITVTAVRSDGVEFPVESMIPGGATYTLKAVLRIDAYPSGRKYRGAVGIEDIVLTQQLVSNFDTNANPYTFNVWVKNIWETTKNVGETDIEYAERVWLPILGDREGAEAALVFSDGWMSASSDYDFKIVDIPVFDQSKTLNGVQSEWRLTLAKTDAEFQATGKMFPNASSAKPVAGDHFFFTGIDMPHKYVEWAEKRLNEKKQAALDDKAYANPTWAIELDFVRVNTLEGNELTTLLDRMDTGIAMKIYDPRFSGGQILQLAIRSMSITWSENTVMKPTASVTLSENVLERSSASEELSYPAIQARVRQAVAQANASRKFVSMGTYDPEAEVVAASAATAIGSTPYLSKTYEDTAYSRLQFLQGAIYGDYAEGLTGTGAKIDPDGHGEMDSLTLRRFLEVPELRFNRTDIQVGNNWRAPGGGLIEHVEIDYSGITRLDTGTIFLKLEEGEIAPVAVNDICMGIFHNETGNADADSDDSKGNFHFAGFSTCYFRVTEILADDGHIFKYALRPTSANWLETHHPQESMTYVAYGNFSDTTRQTSRYSTRTYERYLKGVNDWEITSANVAAQFGDLSNLSVLGLTGMSGYSAYLENIYMTGYLKQTVNPPAKRIDIDTGGRTALSPGEALTLTATAMQGWDNINNTVSSWAITRDSGNQYLDAQWALQPKVTTFNGTITLENTTYPSMYPPDFPDTVASVLFRVTATFSDDSTATGVIAISRLEQGEDGDDAIMVTLDHYSDIMTYDTAGTLLSSSVVVNATLRKGSTDVSSSATWAHSPQRAGINRSDNVITISSMTAAAEDITISATYLGVIYTATFSLKKLIVGDTYEIVADPSAITYNTSTQVASANSITFEVYKNTQGMNGEMTRAKLTSLDTSVYKLTVNGSDVTSSYGNAGYTLSNIPYNYAAITARLQRLQASPASNIRLAGIEVPISKVANGANGQNGTPGQDGDDGPVGITYRVSVWEAGKTYRCDEDGPAQDGYRIIDIVSNKDMSMLSDPDLGIFQCQDTHVSQVGDIDPDDPTVYDPQLWTPINQATLPFATPLLLANKIRADVIDVNSLNVKLLTVKNSSDAIIGRMGDMDDYTVDGVTKKYPFWIGGATPASAVTRIDSNGILETTAIIAKGANSGTTSIIGTFSIDGSGNLNSSLQTTQGYVFTFNIRARGMYFGAARLNSGVAYRIAMGEDTITGSTTSTSFEAMRIENYRPANSYFGGTSNENTALALCAWQGATNRCLKLETAGGDNGYGLHIAKSSHTSSAAKYAIYCEDGIFAGLRPKTIYLDGSTSPDTLTWEDCHVVYNNSSSATLKLPATPKDGQTIILHHLVSTSLTIDGNNKTIFYMRNGTTVSSQASTSREIGILVYSSSFGRWILHFLHL